MVKRSHTHFRSFYTAIQDALRNINIRKRLLFSFIVLTVIPLIIIFSIISWSSYSDSKSQVIANSDTAARQVMLNINNVFENYEQLFRQVSMDNATITNVYTYHDMQSYEQAEFYGQMRSELAAIVCNTRGVDSFEVRDTHGSQFYCGSPITDPDNQHSLLVREIREQPLPTWSIRKKEAVPGDDRDYLLLSKRMTLTSAPEMIGYAVMAVSKSYINTFCSQVSENEQMNIIICDGEGIIIARNGDSPFPDNVDSEFIRHFTDPEKDTSSLSGYQIDGQEYLVSCSPIATADWYVLCLTSREVLMRGPRERVMWFLLILLILIAACILFSLLVTRSISEPAAALAQAMERTTTMGTSVRIDSKWTAYRDEHGMLARGFNEMTSHLDELIEENYRSELNKRSLEFLKKEAELNALQQQINPHFLYNTLETINWMAESADESEIAKVATSLGTFFRHSISRGREFVSVREEIENVQIYIYLQKLRFGDRFDVQWEVRPEIMDCMIIKLILQPIIENAIVHGMEDRIRGGLITISGERDNKILLFSVSDNGCGIAAVTLEKLRAYLDETASEDIQSIGVKNVHQRIRLYYGDEYGLQIDSAEGMGTTVRIRIPVVDAPDVKGGY